MSEGEPLIQPGSSSQPWLGHGAADNDDDDDDPMMIINR
jgi:hypothetical protein